MLPNTNAAIRLVRFNLLNNALRFPLGVESAEASGSASVGAESEPSVMATRCHPCAEGTLRERVRDDHTSGVLAER